MAVFFYYPHCFLATKISLIRALLTAVLVISTFPTANALTINEFSSAIRLNATIKYLYETPAVTVHETSSGLIFGGEVEWQNNPDGRIQYGRPNHPIWFKLEINSDIEQLAEPLHLHIKTSHLREVLLYKVSSEGLSKHVYSVRGMTYDEREVPFRDPVFRLGQSFKEPITIYFRVIAVGAYMIPLELTTQVQLERDDKKAVAWMAMFVGILSTMIIYNLFIGALTRDPDNFYYVFLALTTLCLHFCLEGFGNEYLWPRNPYLSGDAIAILLSLMALSAVLFAKSFLRVPISKHKWDNRVVNGLIGFYLLLIVAYTQISLASYFRLTAAFSLVSVFYGLYAGIKYTIKGYREARIYTISWGVYYLTMVISLLGALDIIAFHFRPQVLVQAGALIEVCLLSMALADKINTEKRERRMAEKEAIKIRFDTLKSNFLSQEKQIEVEAKAKAKGEFLASMSHEIRTPMNGIIGVTTLMEDTELSDQQNDFLKIIKSSGQSLLCIINDILDFSKIEAGKMEIESIPFNIREMLHDLEGLFQTNSKLQDNVELKFQIDKSLSTYVDGDPTRIRQILTNFLSNAFKFTEAGDIAVNVEVDHTSGFTKFSITDSGIGLSKEAQSKLFQSYTQADKSTARKYGGTGLGLTICKNLVGLMKGEIGVESEEGNGSTFWFKIPLPEANETPKDQGELLIEELSRTLKGVNILVAEDNSVNQLIIKKILGKYGMNCQIAKNGEDAFQNYTEADFDFVLMDCEMPVLNGYEATEKIRQWESQNGNERTPIVALTANVMKEQQDKCLAVGMDSHLAKPLDQEQLLSTLARYRAG